MFKITLSIIISLFFDSKIVIMFTNVHKFPMQCYSRNRYETIVRRYIVHGRTYARTNSVCFHNIVSLYFCSIIHWSRIYYRRHANALFVKKKEIYKKMTKFWSIFFLINFAVGIVTGIIQEFQFGMNWSSYSRFMGDVFGAPLAIEALLAFFIESTFIGLWVFGWDKLPKKLHLACIWLVSIATWLISLLDSSSQLIYAKSVGLCPSKWTCRNN